MNFLDEKDPRFASLRGVRDTVARKLHEEGIGASVKHSEALTSEEEEKLWTSGLLGTESPRSLANAVFFSNGKILCLRGGREHYTLKLSQFQFGSDEFNGEVKEYVVYTENGSKNRSGSYRDKTPNKVVQHYAEPILKERCYVAVLKKYFSVLPKEVLDDPQSLFYQQRKEETPVSPGSAWFKKQPRGRNTLQMMVKQVCEKAGIVGKTNHSLRVTGASRLYECHVPEKLIKQRTGHRSLDALRTYERASRAQQQAVSSVIASTEYIDFHGKASALSASNSKDIPTPLVSTAVPASIPTAVPTPLVSTAVPASIPTVKQQELETAHNQLGPHATGANASVASAGWSIQSCSNCIINITVGK